MAQAKKGLGRGLAALIPTDDMDFLSGVARGDFDVNTLTKNLDSKNSAPAVPDDQGIRASKVSKPKTQKSNADSVDAEVSTQVTAQVQADLDNQTNTVSPLRWLTADTIVANPYQPRRSFDDDELQNLADSIREHGILQPIIVRPVEPDSSATDTIERFQLVAGERRWRAAQLAGLSSVPAIVKPVDDQQALELAVIENVQRHDISPLDAALAYRRLAIEFDLSQEKIATRVGKSRSAIANTMRLLELPTEAREALQDGTLSEGHGRAILLAPGEGARRAAFRAVLRDKLSVRDAEELARRIAAGDMPPSVPDDDAKTNAKDRVMASNTTSTRAQYQTDSQNLAEQIQESTGCRVQFRPRRKGGQFVIHCSNPDDIARLAAVIQSNSSSESI